MITAMFMQSLIAVWIRNIHACSVIAYVLLQGYSTAFSGVCVEEISFWGAIS